MPKMLRSEMDAMLSEYTATDFKPVSFMSPRNTNIDLVQFVCKSAEIQKPEKTNSAPAPEKDTIWDRLLALFTRK
jgi:putative membrane protein